MDTTLDDQMMPAAASPLPAARRVLVLAPHADDEVFGCGGTLHLLVQAGAAITVIVASDGALGGMAGERETATLIAEREAETCAAARVLGYPAPAFWRLPDRGIRYGEALVGKVADAIRTTQADLVFAPALTELHPDHQALALAAAEAVRRLGGERRIAFYEASAPVLPNMLIDITACEDAKQEAMRCFRSQLAAQPYDDYITALNRYRSYTLGAQVKAAEAFFIVTAAELANGLAPLFESALGRRRRLGVAVEGADVPLVSVIVRSMDRPTLTEALTSLAAQTYPNIEVLVVNASGGKHSPLTDFDGRLVVRVIEAGAPLTRSRAANAGLEAAAGRFLMFLGDDGLLLPDHVGKLVTTLLESGACAAYSGVRVVDENGSLLRVLEEDWDPSCPAGAACIPIHAVLFDRAPIVKGCRFDEQLDCVEAGDFCLQVSRHGQFRRAPGISAVQRIALGRSGASAAAAEMLDRDRAKLFEKWRDLLSDGEWGIALERLAQQRDRALERGVALEQSSAVLERKCLALTETNTMLTRQNGDLEAALASGRQELQSVMHSRSWRITAPLRWVGSLLRGPNST